MAVSEWGDVLDSRSLANRACWAASHEPQTRFVTEPLGKRSLGTIHPASISTCPLLLSSKPEQGRRSFGTTAAFFPPFCVGSFCSLSFKKTSKQKNVFS